MTTAEIIILIVGAILFTVSFFIPDRDSDKAANGYIDKDIAKKAVKEAVDEEIKNIKSTIDEATEESISENKDKMERFMDRLTNEKMMAVNEYSDTVLNQIHKDHDEAVFLYDMIDSKYNQVKSTAAEINQIEKSVKRLSEEVPKNLPGAKTSTEEKVDYAGGAIKTANTNSFVSNTVEVTKAPVGATFITESPVKEEKNVADNEVDKSPATEKAEETASDNKVDTAVFEPMFAEQLEKISDTEEPKPVKKRQPKAKKAADVEASAEPIANSNVELMFDNGSMNNNDRILALHKEGKSNMAIAKELGLGVGEVKLVIDLFKSN